MVDLSKARPGVASLIGTAGCTVLMLLAANPISAQEPPIKIGALMAFTGPAAFQTASHIVAVRMGVKEINDSGGILGRRVEIVQADDQFDPAQSVNEARRLVQQEKVSFVLGPEASTLALADAPVFTDGKVVYFSTSVSPVPSPYNFSPFMSAASQAEAMARFAAETLKAKTTVWLSDNGAAAKAALQDLRRLLPQMGIELKGTQEHETRASDITPQLLALRRLNPDVILHSSSTGEDGGLLLKTLADIGWDVRVVSTSIAQATAGAMKIAGPDAFKSGRYYGLLASAFTYCPSEEAGGGAYGKYLARLKAFAPDSFDKMDQKNSIALYDALIAIKAAAEGTRSLDGPVLVAWLEKNGATLKGAAGLPMAFSSTNHFQVGPKTISFVTRPDSVRPSDKLVQRADCPG